MTKYDYWPKVRFPVLSLLSQELGNCHLLPHNKEEIDELTLPWESQNRRPKSLPEIKMRKITITTYIDNMQFFYVFNKKTKTITDDFRISKFLKIIVPGRRRRYNPWSLLLSMIRSNTKQFSHSLVFWMELLSDMLLKRLKGQIQWEQVH